MDDGYHYHYARVRVEDDIFFTLRGHGNGNTHFQFNQKFMKCFNLEVARLRQWVKSPQEAATEFDISEEEATEYWDSNFALLPSHVSNLLPNMPQSKPDVPNGKGDAVLYSEEQVKHFQSTGALL